MLVPDQDGNLVAATRKKVRLIGSAEIEREYGFKLSELDFSNYKVVDRKTQQEIKGNWEIQYDADEDQFPDTIPGIDETGYYRITAVFTPDDLEYQSLKTKFSLYIRKLTPTITLTAAATPDATVEHHSATLTATVTGKNDIAELTGEVTFYYQEKGKNEKKLGTVKVENGKAVYTWEDIPTGNYTLRAEYGGDDYYKKVEGTTIYDKSKASQAALKIVPVGKKTVGDKPFALVVTGGSGTGAISYAVTAGDSVTVDESTGLVTILKAGSSTITVTKAADENYREATATITIVVEEKSTDLWFAVLLKRYSTKYPVIVSVNGEATVTSSTGEDAVYYKKNITCTITPDEGWEIESVIANGEDLGAVSEFTLKRVTKLQTVVVNLIQSCVNPYDDVAADNAAVQYVTENGLMTAVEDGKFAPDAAATRALVTDILYTLAGKPTFASSVTINDAADNLALNWAVANEFFALDENGLVHPDAELTLEALNGIFNLYASTTDVAYITADDMTATATRAHVAEAVYMLCTISEEG